LRLVFAGTPAAALPSLRLLLDSARHDVVAVLTRPDAPAGRGRTLRPSPVKELAAAHGVPVLTPPRLGEAGVVERLREFRPQCCPVVAYGALVPPTALDVPDAGWVNLHFSLLPAWRGAAPVQRAILAGDDITGATTFRLEHGLDTGPAFGVLTTAIRPFETAGDLIHRLSVDGAELLLQTLDGIEAGTIEARPQPAEGVSLAPKLTVEEARLDWSEPAVAVDRRARACTPAPGAWTTFRGDRLGLGPLHPVPGIAPLPPGRLMEVKGTGIVVGTSTDPLVLGDVRPAGRTPMAATAWARGARLGDDGFV
jgi:methionyl-tRNA formyltransferase